MTAQGPATATVKGPMDARFDPADSSYSAVVAVSSSCTTNQRVPACPAVKACDSATLSLRHVPRAPSASVADTRVPPAIEPGEVVT